MSLFSNRRTLWITGLVGGVAALGSWFLWRKYSHGVNEMQQGDYSNFTRQALLNEAQKVFLTRFRSKASHAGVAPGRVNLIGEHTDYSDGFVCPMAIERYTVLVGRFNDSKKFRFFSANRPTQDAYVEYTIEEILEKPKSKKWENYLIGVIAEYHKASLFVPPFDAVVLGNVPLGGGLSSSASLEVATASLLDALLNVVTDPTRKALRCQSAEHQYAGVPCGIMDQFICTSAHEGYAMLLDCRSYEPHFVPITNPSVAFLISNSNVSHELSGGEYAQRRSQCEEAVKVLAKVLPDVKALRDVRMEDLDSVKANMSDVVYRRARHVISENARCQSAAEALQKNDYASFGKLMKQSHLSLQHDFEVSCPELDFLSEVANAQPGVYGARMTGGGFGGCTVTLLDASRIRQIQSVLKREYRKKFSIEPTFMVSRPGQGAESLVLHN